MGDRHEGQSDGTAGSDQGSGDGWPSGAPDRGRSSGYQAERYVGLGQGLRVFGLTDDRRLVSFRSGRPSRVTTVGRIFGLKGDRSLVGIDYRVQDGKLYGVGDRGGVYTINTRNASVVKVSQLTVALDGRFFGVDFNPAANRLRVISDTGQNLRHNLDDPAGMPAAGTTATDTMLSYPPATGAASGVTGAAYTNNDLSSGTATTLEASPVADRTSMTAACTRHQPRHIRRADPIRACADSPPPPVSEAGQDGVSSCSGSPNRG